MMSASNRRSSVLYMEQIANGDLSTNNQLPLTKFNASQYAPQYEGMNCQTDSKVPTYVVPLSPQEDRRLKQQ